MDSVVRQDLDLDEINAVVLRMTEIRTKVFLDLAMQAIVYRQIFDEFDREDCLRNYLKWRASFLQGSKLSDKPDYAFFCKFDVMFREQLELTELVH